jgi:NAD-dependent DNA ligase
MVAFFTILDVENVSEGVCAQFYQAGYNTIHKVLNMSRTEMEALDRFGKRKAEIVHNSIHSRLQRVPLSKLQHATGFFKGLGSKKLLLLEHFDKKPSLEEITAITGFSQLSATAYLEAYDKFFDFITGLPIRIEKTEKQQASSDELEGMSFCFTGVRRKDLEEKIISKGGTIASGVSQSLSYLVMKEKGSGSSKETKALALGVKLLTVDELEAMLNA